MLLQDDITYLQIAFDIPYIEKVKNLFGDINSHPQLILEIGTPLLKNEGLKTTIKTFTAEVFSETDF